MDIQVWNFNSVILSFNTEKVLDGIIRRCDRINGVLKTIISFKGSLNRYYHSSDYKTDDTIIRVVLNQHEELLNDDKIRIVGILQHAFDTELKCQYVEISFAVEKEFVFVEGKDVKIYLQDEEII
jgi:hypothetical protein